LLKSVKKCSGSPKIDMFAFKKIKEKQIQTRNQHKVDDVTDSYLQYRIIIVYYVHLKNLSYAKMKQN
jgi:hypothetical protein